MKKDLSAKLAMLLAVLIFGTGGIVSRFCDYSAAAICFARGLLGSLVLLLAMGVTGRRFTRGLPVRTWLRLALSGAAIGVNWILLFEAYRHTTVAVSTLCYYMAPMIVLLLAPLVLKERLTLRKLLCVLCACAGMALVSGVIPGGLRGLGGEHALGVILALGAALFYAAVILLNKTAPDGPTGLERTVVQLAAAAAIILPYLLLTEDFAPLRGGASVWVLLWLGVVNTGVAYLLYFSSMGRLPASTVAFMSYIDPLTAVLLSFFLLAEPLSLWGWVGAALILGAALVAELPEKRTEPATLGSAALAPSTEPTDAPDSADSDIN